jgi:hypothetical protein
MNKIVHSAVGRGVAVDDVSRPGFGQSGRFSVIVHDVSVSGFIRPGSVREDKSISGLCDLPAKGQRRRQDESYNDRLHIEKQYHTLEAA